MLLYHLLTILLWVTRKRGNNENDDQNQWVSGLIWHTCIDKKIKIDERMVKWSREMMYWNEATTRC